MHGKTSTKAKLAVAAAAAAIVVVIAAATTAVAVVVCVAVCAIIVALPHLGAIEIGARAFRSMHFKLRMRKPWGGIKFGACCGLTCVALLFKL